jgi:hypothetical protein
MDGANQRFMNGRSAWLADHLILYQVTQSGAWGNNPYNQATGTIATTLPIYRFDLRKLGGIINNGAAAKAYELHALDDLPSQQTTRTTGMLTHPIDAYFLPWAGNTTFRGQLGNGARFFFTPTLNGCTFAYEGVGPNVSVAHSNFVGANQLADQNAMDNDLAAVFGHAPAHTLIKTTYKPAVFAAGAADYRAMVIGIRTGNTWNFYYQNYYVSLNPGAAVTQTGVGLCTAI